MNLMFSIGPLNFIYQTSVSNETNQTMFTL